MARALSRICIVVLAMSAASMFSLPPLSSACGTDDDAPTWTVMVYMAADAEPVLPWEDDINEMEVVDLADSINVVVLVDPLGFGNSMMLHIAEDASPDIVSPEIDDAGQVVPAYGEVDMASPDTLMRFITFCANSYAADRLALVLWGHSGGWYGLCQDGLSALRLYDLADALGTATDELGRKIDIVVADSCSEGVLETMYDLRDYADWYVGSEMAVPAQGLRYDLVLDRLSKNQSMSPGTWGAIICEINRVTLYFESWSATMATFDLGAMDTFMDRFDELSSYMEGYAGLYRSALLGALQQTAEIDLVEWYIDVGDALRKLMDATLPLEIDYLALEARKAYDRLVYDFEVYTSPFEDNHDQVANCTGAAVYVPSSDPADEPYWSISFSRTSWADAAALIRSDGPSAVNTPPPDITYDDTDEDGGEDRATLHWEPGSEQYVAWVFVQTPSGLQFLDRLESTDPDMVLEGFAGELLVSVSAWDDGNATSHHLLNILLSRDLEVRVRVMSGAGPVTEGMGVQILTHRGPITLSPSEGFFMGTINVPSDADYGELMTVQVTDGNGEAIAQNRTYVQGLEVTLEVRVHGQTADPPGSELVIPSAVLGVSALAVAFYIRIKKMAPGKKN